MCLGTGMIILLLAERLQCPIYGVMLPGHFYCRYDNGTIRFNIEPNNNGINHDDSYYRARYAVADSTEYSLQNMTQKQVVGLACYNIGTLCMEYNDISSALYLLNTSLHFLPNYSEAEGNYALAYAKEGKTDSSLIIFGALFEKKPGLNNLAVNYGSVALQAKRYKLAETVFTTGLHYFPDNPVLLCGLAAAEKAQKP
jgi:tetratricopeptide (TPR) repeat protein